VPDSAIISAINAAWAVSHPSNPNLVIFSADDDGMLLWLSDQSQAAANFVKQYLLTHSASGNDINGNPITVSASGLKKVYAGAQSAAFFGVPNGDPRHPRRSWHRAARRRLHRRHEQDRRARRQRPAGPERADPRGAARRAAGRPDPPPGRDDADRPAHPDAPRPGPEPAAGRPDRPPPGPARHRRLGSPGINERRGGPPAAGLPRLAMPSGGLGH